MEIASSIENELQLETGEAQKQSLFSSLRGKFKLAVLLAVLNAGCPATANTMRRYTTWEPVLVEKASAERFRGFDARRRLEPVPTPTEDKIITTEEPKDIKVEAKIDGRYLSMLVQKIVDIKRIKEVTEREIQHEERESDELGKEFLGATCLGLSGICGYRISDKGSGIARDGSPNMTDAIAGGAVVGSAIIAGHGIYTAIKAIDKHEPTGQTRIRQISLPSDEKTVPLAGASIVLNTSEGNFPIGKTDAEGRLNVELAKAIPTITLSNIIINNYFKNGNIDVNVEEVQGHSVSISVRTLLPNDESAAFEKYVREKNIRRKILFCQEFLRAYPNSLIAPAIGNELRLNQLKASKNPSKTAEDTGISIDDSKYSNSEFRSTMGTLFVNAMTMNQNERELLRQHFVDYLKDMDVEEIRRMFLENQPYILMLVEQLAQNGLLPKDYPIKVGISDVSESSEQSSIMDRKNYQENLEGLRRMVLGLPEKNEQGKDLPPRSTNRKGAEVPLWASIVQTMNPTQKRDLVMQFLREGSVEDAQGFISACIMSGVMTKKDALNIYLEISKPGQDISRADIALLRRFDQNEKFNGRKFEERLDLAVKERKKIEAQIKFEMNFTYSSSSDSDNGFGAAMKMLFGMAVKVAPLAGAAIAQLAEAAGPMEPIDKGTIQIEAPATMGVLCRYRGRAEHNSATAGRCDSSSDPCVIENLYPQKYRVYFESYGVCQPRERKLNPMEVTVEPGKKIILDLRKSFR